MVVASERTTDFKVLGNPVVKVFCPLGQGGSQVNYIGIDPGRSGGIAIITEYTVHFCKLSETERDIADWLFQRTHVGVFGGQRALLEKVHSMPKQGVASTFTFGTNYGFLRGLLTGLKISFDDVTPQRWQKAMGCLTHGDKNLSKAKAQQLFPELKITHATADALLIAEYCRRINERPVTEP
jgi:hypothetical protein